MRKAALVLIFLLTGLAVQVTAQCPTIKVIGPAGITNPGDDITFRVELNVIGPKLRYSWSVDEGTIIKGQGTPEMTLATVGLDGVVVAATVKVYGLPQHCESSATESAGLVGRTNCIMPSDQWTTLKPNDERGRLDMFFAELSNSPDDVGVIVLTVTKDEKRDSTDSRIHFALKHAKFRKFDKSRLRFALDVGEERQTTLWRVLPGGEFPCSECLVLPGEIF